MQVHQRVAHTEKKDFSHTTHTEICRCANPHHTHTHTHTQTHTHTEEISPCDVLSQSVLLQHMATGTHEHTAPHICIQARQNASHTEERDRERERQREGKR